MQSAALWHRVQELEAEVAELEETIDFLIDLALNTPPEEPNV